MHHIKNTFVEGSRKLKSSQCCEMKSSTKSVIETCEFLTEVKSIKVTQSKNEVDQPKSMYKGHIEDASFFLVVKYLQLMTSKHSYFSVLKFLIIRGKFKELELRRV